jgi:hypothetical protein
MDNPNNGNVTGASGTPTEQAIPDASTGCWIPTDQLRTASPFADLFRVRKTMVARITDSRPADAQGKRAAHSPAVREEEGGREDDLRRVPHVPTDLGDGGQVKAHMEPEPKLWQATKTFAKTHCTRRID